MQIEKIAIEMVMICFMPLQALDNTAPDNGSFLAWNYYVRPPDFLSSHQVTGSAQGMCPRYQGLARGHVLEGIQS